MPDVKRITDFENYKSVLPYASELFGVYQPMIGWRSKRVLSRVKAGVTAERDSLISRLGRNLENKAAIAFNEDCFVTAPDLAPGRFAEARLIDQSSIVLQQVRALLVPIGGPPSADKWQEIANADSLTRILRTSVLDYYRAKSIDSCKNIARLTAMHETETEFQTRKAALKEDSHRSIKKQLDDEAVIAGVLQVLAESRRDADLNAIFYTRIKIASKDNFFQDLDKADNDFVDPYLTFDPKKDVKDVSLSPLGIVHLFRQFFFELDSFLGTPQGHVWLSPGSSVELLEVSTRKTVTEKTVESSTETDVKTESSTTSEDEISDAVKQDNKDDLKLGFSSTVNQSWGTGNATATGSLNMDKTQGNARENTHKRMRQQTDKLSTEIRQNYKTTFKVTTEVTDTSSKRYVLANTTAKLINYELRRKMRQVAVQVQDVGSYLCWETFVDEPGATLGLANLVHIAEPADLLPVPDQTEAAYPPDRVQSFQTNAVWNYGDNRQFGFVPLTLLDPPPPPEGYEVVRETGMVPVLQISGSGEDFNGVWAFGGQFTPTGQLNIGVITAPDGMSWDERIDFVVGGALRYTPTAAKRTEIDAANAAKKAAGEAATRENDRITKTAFIKAAKERVELASGITKRQFEELRDEERIIVYRNLISSLMTGYQYTYADDRSRHVLSELINSVFDIDKMLYFVAPEWWKPREHAKQFLSLQDLQSKLDGSIVSWSDSRPRPDNYLITDKSVPAAMGSSLGWLLQLDGDSLRNAFLNAPWVKAVIPVRPGKEQAAINWLQNVAVEGSEGLGAAYAAPADELDEIRTKLGLPAGQVVTISDAVNALCLDVAAKHAASVKTKSYPDTEINVDNKVTATPVEKVYEHGFYPLQGGFRVDPDDPNPDPNNKDTNFQVFDQWIEVLPTDQVVPVEVEYDPKTGRQI